MTGPPETTIDHPSDGGRATPYHHGDLPAALLAAVGRLIERDGVGAVSLRAAAREVGVSHAAPAHHFGDKKGLLTAFALQGYELFSAALAGALADAPADDPRAGMRALGRAYIDFAREHRAHYEVMFRPELAERTEVAARRSADDAFEVLRRAVAAALPDDEPDERTVLQLALLAWSAVHGMVHLWFEGPLQHMQTEFSLEDLQEGLAVLFGPAFERAAHHDAQQP